MRIEIKPINVLYFLLGVTSVLLVANIAAQIYTTNFDPVNFIADLFDFNTERNVPTLFSTLILIIAAFFLILIASMHKKRGEAYLAWFVLSMVFLFLSVDELASLHEYLNSFFSFSGVLYYGWVIPYVILLFLLAIIYVPFLRKLPLRFTKLFFVAGVIFVFGAVGIEVLGGLEEQTQGDETIKYFLFYTVEELFEMLGVSVFIYALLTYISSEFPETTFSVTEQK